MNEPRCANLSGFGYTCQRLRGHEGKHGHAGVFWCGMDEEAVEEFQRRVAELGAKLGDNEGDHLEEDGIYVDALRAIRDGCKNPRDVASAALEAKKLEYNRWYA